MATTQSELAQTPQAVIEFWKQAGPKQWFAKDQAFDRLFGDTFHTAHFQASRRELEHWMA